MLVISTPKIDVLFFFSIACFVKGRTALYRLRDGNKIYAIASAPFPSNLSQCACMHVTLLASLKTIYRVYIYMCIIILAVARQKKNVWIQWKWIIPWQQTGRHGGIYWVRRFMRRRRKEIPLKPTLQLVLFLMKEERSRVHI